MKNVKWMSLVLALVLCLFALSAQAEEQTVTIAFTPQVELPDNDELFAMYAEGQLYGYGGISLFGTRAGDALSGVPKQIYSGLKPMIEAVAAGTQTSTVFTVDLTAAYTTAADIDAAAALFQADFSKANDALLADCPFELFWFDKISKTNISMTFSNNDPWTISKAVVSMPVAGDYANGEYTVNALPAKVATAASAAQTLVANNASKSDMEKLEVYKEYICGAVSYDTAAAEAGDAYFSATDIDPWQLISVFDGDDTTNVVCEGYSKAFQYLCDLSTFNDVAVYTVSGDMAGGTGAGPHMWNIVSMGGKNYLVDVTNSDTGTVGADGSLFMAKAASGSVANGYVFTASGENISFVYDSDQKSLWGEGVLTLAVSCPHDFVGGVCDLCGEVCEHPSFTGGVCTTCGIIGGYCGGEGDGTNLMWTLNDGTFAITGTGTMADYGRYTDSPWYTYRNSITSLTIQEGVTTIGRNAFFQTAGLKSVTIPASVTKLGYCAFAGSGLETITFADESQLTTIDYYAFQNCEALTEITLPAGVGSFWTDVVFYGCTALTDIHVAEGNTTYKGVDGVLYTADGTTLMFYPEGKTATSFTTPAGVTAIGQEAFSHNDNIKSVTLSEGVTSIGDQAFLFCGALAEVNIPASVTSIGTDAFFGCDALTAVNAPCNWDGSLYTFPTTVTVNVAEHTPDENSYTDNGDGTHDVTCATCGAVLVKNGDHTFTQNDAGEWVCACTAQAVAMVEAGGTATCYTDFADAVAAWTDGTTLTLLDDVSYDSAINLGAGTRTFAGGKHTLDLGSANINNTGTLTITSGTITADYLQGGTIENSGELIINGNSVISNNGNSAVINFKKFEATGGTLTASIGLDNEDDGTAVLNGTILTDIINWGNVTIEDCTLTETGAEVDYRGGSITIIDDCCADWVLINNGSEGLTIDVDVILPTGYCLFDNAGKFIDTLAGNKRGTITEHEHKTLPIDNKDGKSHDLGCDCGAMSNQVISHFAPNAEGKCLCGAQIVAQVDTAYYSDFTVAVADWTANGGTMTLLADVSYNGNIDLGSDATRTFVGGSHILTLEGDWYNSGILTLESGTINGNNFRGLFNYGTLNMNGGTITGTTFGVVNNATLKITGGTVNSGNQGVYTEGTGTTEISGGTINGENFAVTADGGTTTITGAATINGGSESHDFCIFGGTINLSECTTVEGLTVVNQSTTSITIGKEADKTLRLPENYYVFDEDNLLKPELVSGSSGTITEHEHKTLPIDNKDGKSHDLGCDCGAMSNQVIPHFAPNAETGKCICGAQIVAQVGEAAYYSDFTVAVADWTANGGTMTLLADVSYNGDSSIVLENGAIRTLVGEGHTLDLGSKDMTNGDTLTIQGGTITSAYPYSGAIYNAEAGTLTISGDTTINNDQNNAVDNYGTLTVTGGSLTGDGGLLNGGGATAALKGTTLLNVESNGTVTLTNCTLTSNVYDISYKGGKLTIEGDCAGWMIINDKDGAAVVGTDIKLPANYYLFDNADKIVTSLKADGVATIKRHDHNHTFTADDNTDTITYACSCGLDTLTAKLLAPAGDLVYNGQAYAATVEADDGMPGTAIVYRQNGADMQEAKNAGNYTATISYDNAEVSVNFTIVPASLETATVTADDVPYTGYETQPDLEVLMGQQLLVPTEDYQATWPEDQTNAGEKTVTIKGMGNYTGEVQKTYKITKATPEVDPPEAIEGLTYSGVELVLVRFGRTSGGTLLYSLDGQNWSENEPVAIEAGDYTVYYKVDGGTNYEDVAVQTLTATIGKGIAGLTNAPTANNRTYDGTQQPLVDAGTVNEGTLVYSTEKEGTYSATVPVATNAGNYTVWYYVQGGDNLEDSEKAAVPVEIKPIELEVIADDAAYAKTYDGTTSAENADWKQMPYLGGQLLPDAAVQMTMDPLPDYSTSKVGSYDVEIGVKLGGDDAKNYKLNTDKVTVTAIIEPKPLTATMPEGARAYDATAKWSAPLNLTGVIDGDDVSSTAEFTLGSANVGEYTTATLETLNELTGEDAGNYTLAKEDVTFTKVIITKAAADKWSANMLTPQDVLVGSGLNAVIVPTSGTGIGNENVTITALTFYTYAAMQNPATDADVSILAEGESVTLYYKAETKNYEAITGAVTLTAIDHQHEWTYTADEDTDIITAKCSGTIGTCPDAEQSVTLYAPDVTYSGNPVEAEVTCEGTSLTYTLQYSPNAPTNAGEYTVTMTVGDKSVSDTFTINPKDISKVASCQFSLAENSFTYNGAAPELTVTAVDNGVGSYTMQKGTDYTVGTVEGIDAGEYTLAVTGKGNYTGTVELDYEITRAPIGAAVITAEDRVYTGKALEPAFTVTLDGKTLSRNDYVFEWTNNVNVGTGKIEIFGVGNYYGQAEGTFAITMADAVVTAQADKTTYTYGETITVTATRAAKPATFALRAAPAADQMALFLGDVQISDAVDAVNGTYTMTVNTADKDMIPGTSTLSVAYISNGNLKDAEAEVTVTLNPKKLTIASAEATDRVYAKDDKLVDVTGVTLEGIISGDDVAADLTGVQGTLASDSAGDYTTLALPRLELTGSDKDYYTIAADDTVTTDVTITKAQLVGAELPTDVTLDTYLTSAEQVADKLPATITYTDGNGDTLALDATWTCADFDATPKAVNTFTWTVDTANLTNHELASGVAATGTIKVTNTDALPVTITGTDDSITFAQQPYGVADMFAVDANAGDAHYEVVSGDAVLNGATLTVNKVGEIVIRLTTEANGAYASAEATATLTVTKADPAVTAPEGLAATYGKMLANVELPESDEGTWAWVNPAEPVGDAGTQTHKVTFTPNDTINWNTLTLDVQVTVSKYNTQVELMVLNGETETSIFTYGETVTVLALPQRPAVLSLRSFTPPAADQMALFLGDEQISEAVDADENGIYTMTIETADKALEIGDNAVALKYVGTDNMTDAQGEVTVTLKKKLLSITNMTAKSRAYQPENQQVDVTAVELEGKIEGDDVAVGTLTAQVSSANVGTYAEAKLPQTVPLAGADADYYEAVGNVEVPVPQKVSITQATPTPTGTGADAGQPAVTPVTEDGKTLADIPLTLPEGAYNVPGTIHWVDGDETPVEEGKEYAWVFIPEDPNYAPVNGTVVIYPAGEAPVITAPAAAQTVTVVEGETGTMTVTATEADAYQWYINRNDGKGYVAMDGATAATYTTSKVNTANDGFTYYCQVSNAYGESKSPVFTLKVKAEVDVPQTGDEAQLGLWLALMALSLGGLTAMVMNRKRGEN